MNQNNNRRTFIKKGLTTAAGIGILSNTKSITHAEKLAALINGSAMPKRKLGKTGYNVSLFGLGGQATIEHPDRRDEAVEIINRAIDLGVNYIDTAAYYGADAGGRSAMGTSERHIGEVMKHRRNEVFLATKSHSRSYNGTMRLFEQSLRNLKTDHVDLYQLHNVRWKLQLRGIFSRFGAIRAFERLKSEGSVRYLGITGHYDPEVIQWAIEQYGFDCILMSLNAADIHYLPFQYDLLNTAREKNLGIIGMKVAARGKVFRNDGIHSMEQALNYVYSLPVSTAIVGISTLNELEENVRITRNFQKYNKQEINTLAHHTAHYYKDANY